MGVDECIEQYLQFAETVFQIVHRLPVNLKGKTHGRYNSEAFENPILTLLKSRNLPPDTLLKDDDPYACKVWVDPFSNHTLTMDLTKFSFKLCLR